jgi:hypothetical protein
VPFHCSIKAVSELAERPPMAAENTRTARGAAAEAQAPLTATVLSAIPAAAARNARVIRLI